MKLVLAPLLQLPCHLGYHQKRNLEYKASKLGGAFLQLESQPEPEATTASTSETTESSSGIHRGGVTSWRDFRAEKYILIPKEA